MYDDGSYENMLELLKAPDEKTVIIKLRYRKNKLKDFKLDIKSLADAYNDDRFLQMELVGWGLNDKSCMEIAL